jgi:hypothetical protein
MGNDFAVLREEREGNKGDEDPEVCQKRIGLKD